MARPFIFGFIFVIASVSSNVARAQAAPPSEDAVARIEAEGVSLRLRPVLQLDGRFFVAGGTNTFLARRVRPAIEGTFSDRFDVRFTPEFGQSWADGKAAAAPSVVDAYANFRIVRAVQLRFGKFKAPVGLERNQADQDLHFVERGLATNLVPDRDVGVQVWGEILDGTIVYAGGVFDGSFDGKQTDGDANDEKDLEGRLLVRPFAVTSIAALEGLTLGIAATTGRHDGAAPGYVSAGQITFFSWDADVVAGGPERRVVPQASWYVGPIGVWGEYAWVHEAMVRNPTGGGSFSTGANLQGFTAAVVAVVTGERATYGTLRPQHVFDPERGGFGAIELDARVSGLHVDDVVYSHASGVADNGKSARNALEWAVGAQWHFAPGIKFVVDYFQTTFEQGAVAANRPTEKVLIGRFQIAY